MSDQAMLEHIKRLDYLYLAALVEHDRWLADESTVNRRRADFTHRRYIAALVEGQRRFGLSSHPAKREAS